MFSMRLEAARSALRFTQRRAIDSDGVAVMAKAAQERVHHVAITEEVVPFVIS